MKSSALPRFPLAVLAVFVAVGVSLGGAASPASAHDQLLSTDPAAGSSVDALPAAITLGFSAELLGDGGGNEIQVTDAAGTALADGPAEVDGTRLVQALTGDASGEVTVLWRAVSSDGHPISGEFAFVVTAAPAPSPTTSAAPTASASNPAAAPTPTDEANPGPTPSASAPTDAAPSGAASPLPWIILAIVLVAGGGAVVFLLVSRARQNGRTGADGASRDDSRGGSEPPTER